MFFIRAFLQINRSRLHSLLLPSSCNVQNQRLHYIVVISHLLCFGQETWSPAHSLVLKIQKHRRKKVRVAERQHKVKKCREAAGLTVTAPLQVCDLQLQTCQHDQVLLLQEGNAPLHTGHLLLQPPRIHRRNPAQPERRCWKMAVLKGCGV